MLSDWRLVRSFSPDVWRMLAVFALNGFAYFGVQAVLLNLYLVRLGFGADYIGPLLGFGQLVWAVMALPASVVGRRFGTRPALLIWQGLHALGLTLMLLVETLPASLRPAWLFFGWSIFWMGGALGAVNGSPFLMRVTTAENRNQVFASQVAVFALLGLVGSAIAGALPGLMLGLTGGTLNDPAPYRLALWLAPACHVGGFLILTRISSARPKPEAASGAGQRPWRILAFFTLIVFLQTASEGAVRSFFNVYLDTTLRMPAAEIGGVFGLGQFFAIIAALFAPNFLKRAGSAKLIVWVSLGSGLALAALGGLPYALPAMIGYAGVLMMSAFITAARLLFGQEMVTAEWRTLASAVQTIGLGLGWAFAATIGGAFITQYGFGPYFLLSAGIAGIGALLMFAYSRRKKSGRVRFDQVGQIRLPVRDNRGMKRTKALDALAAAGIAHEVREFEASEFTAEETARELDLPLNMLFKTLVTRGERRGVMLALVPGNRELSLRKLAQAAGDKRVELVDVAELPRLTGYLKGGCSPLGIKVGGRTGYPTFIDASAFAHPRISISAGLRGVQALLDPRDLAKMTNATTADLADG